MHDEFTTRHAPARARHITENIYLVTDDTEPARLRVIIYCRVSTKDQEDYGTSLDRQEKLCIEYAERMGWEVVAIYREDYSGLTLDRPDFNQVRHSYHNGECDVLLSAKVDRLSRDMADPAIIWKDLEHSRVQLHTAEDGAIDTREKFLFFMMKANIAAGYVAEFKKNAKGGRQDRAKDKHRLIGGHWLFGYDYIHGDKRSPDGGVRVINPAQARIVQLVFHLYTVERLTLSALASRLSEMGAVSARGNHHWSRESLRKMLKQVAYTGRTWALLKDEDLAPTLLPEGTTPRLISDDSFALAQALLHENRGCGGGPTRDYLLSGLIICPVCGWHYGPNTKAKHNKNGTTNEYVYYGCNTATVSPAYQPAGRRSCDAPNIAAKKIEPQIWSSVRAYILQPELIEVEMERRRHGSAVLLTERDLEIVEDGLRELEQEEAKLIQYAMKAPDNATTAKLIDTEQSKIATRRGALEGKQAQLARALEGQSLSIRQRTSLLALCAELAERIDQLTTAEKNRVLRRLHTEITLRDGRVEVTGYFPTFSVTAGEGWSVPTQAATSGHRPTLSGVPFSFSFPLAS